MKLQTRVKGYTVKGRDHYGYFTSGLYETLAGARKSYNFMMNSSHNTDKVKKTLTIIKITEVEELVDLS